MRVLTIPSGVGTMSSELAKEVWQKQVSLRKRHRHKKNIPGVVQIRLGGAKGMLSVDTRLQGRMVCLRDSMTKFDSPALEIEIARAFTRPGRMFLNRPMIMLLEGLGVESHVFMQLQHDAVEDTMEATKDIGSAAQLIESFGLGSAYRLPSVLQGLRKLDLSFGPNAGTSTIHSHFLTSVLDCTVHHALRELKYHSRIPVPGSWTLVGVADIHKELGEGEIFACILDIGDSEAKYLEGPCLITRSPVIHPGDLQMVHAIGRPPQGSRYTEEPLANSVVFSVLGSVPTRAV
jgi:RNA-dependent RNA polymerase